MLLVRFAFAVSDTLPHKICTIKTSFQLLRLKDQWLKSSAAATAARSCFSTGLLGIPAWPVMLLLHRIMQEAFCWCANKASKYISRKIWISLNTTAMNNWCTQVAVVQFRWILDAFKSLFCNFCKWSSQCQAYKLNNLWLGEAKSTSLHATL